MKVIITEKLSVAISIAGILGLKYGNRILKETDIDSNSKLYQNICRWAEQKKFVECICEKENYVLVWLYGNLFRAKKINEYEDEDKHFPFIPKTYEITLKKEFKTHYAFLKKVLKSKKAEKIFLCTDPDTEGCYLGKILLDEIKPKVPIRRLWLESITSEEVLKALRNNGENINDRYTMFVAGKCRAYADWLLGMNYSWLVQTNIYNKSSSKYSRRKQKSYPVGRVKLCLLQEFIKREDEIKNFKPDRTYSINLNIDIKGTKCKGKYIIEDLLDEQRKDKNKMNEICSGVKDKYEVLGVNKNISISKPAGLMNLTKLIEKAYSLYKFNAKVTTSICQNLYRKKFISYPRTSSCYLKEDQVNDVRDTLKHLSEVDDKFKELYEHIDKSNISPFYTKVFKDNKVKGHYALIPTKQKITQDMIKALTENERKIYFLIVKTLYVAFMPPKYTETEKILIGEHGADKDEAAALIKLSRVIDVGYAYKTEKVQTRELPAIYRDDIAVIEEKTVNESISTVKSRYNDGSIMRFMEENNIGTEATRSLAIEDLLKLNYIRRYKEQLFPTNTAYEVVKNFDVEEMLEPFFTEKLDTVLGYVETGIVSEEEFINTINNYILDNWNNSNKDNEEGKNENEDISEKPE